MDRFGTLVTNLTPELVPPYAVVEVEGIEVDRFAAPSATWRPAGWWLMWGPAAGGDRGARRLRRRRLGMGVGGRVRARLG